MKTIICATMLGIASFYQINLQAQTIPNSNMEGWESSGNPAPFDWEEPTGWKSTNPLTEFTLAGVKKTTDAYEGSFACELTSVNISGGWPSAICNGSPNLIGSPFTDPSIEIITGGTPILSKPNSLVGYYKFDNNNPLDSGYAVVILKKYNTSLNKYDTIGMGDFHFPEVSSFTRFEIPINDLMPSETPDSIVVAFYSTDPQSPMAPNFPSTGLTIDSLALNFTPSSIQNEREYVNEPIIYPNPANDIVMIEWESSLLYKIRLYNLLGHFVKAVEGKGKAKLDITKLPKGQYFLRILEENDTMVFTKSFIVN